GVSGTQAAVYVERAGERSIQVFDYETGAVTRTIPVPGKDHMWFTSLGPDGSVAYVAGGGLWWSPTGANTATLVASGVSSYPPVVVGDRIANAHVIAGM